MKGLGYYHSPIGILKISSEDNYISTISFVEKEDIKIHNTAIIESCINQLKEYFEHKRKEFNIPLKQKGSEFQQAVWTEMENIKFGKIFSYGQLACNINKPSSARAVGMACSKNNIPIIIPCHRVVGSNGKLTGYAGGLRRKEWFLKHETKK